MNYSEIKNCDIANGPGVRVSLFVSGCSHHCKGCFQPETWNFNYGAEFTEETMEKIINMLEPSYIQGLTLLGGDPMEPDNQPYTYNIIKCIKEKLPYKDIWVYTGCLFDELLDKNSYYYTEYTEKILINTDVLVDGPFKEELKNISLLFRGSENQRLIMCKESINKGQILLYS